MIIALFFVAVVLITSGLKGTERELGAQLAKDVAGSGGFLPWFLCVLAIGCLGYIPAFRTSSRYLLILLAAVILLRNQGVFGQAQQAIQGLPSVGPAPSVPPEEGKTSSSSGGGGGGTGGLSVGTLAELAVLAG